MEVKKLDLVILQHRENNSEKGGTSPTKTMWKKMGQKLVGASLYWFAGIPLYAPHSLDSVPKTHRTRLSMDSVLRHWSERGGFIHEVPTSSERPLSFDATFFAAIAREGEG